MTRDQFWDHVEAARRPVPHDHAEQLTARLATLPPDEIVAFGRMWHELRAAAYTNALWGAAYLMNGGCSDDGFEYFRNWLVLQGRRTYESALADPDGLASADWEQDAAECECYPAEQAYQVATGADVDASFAAVGPVAADDPATPGDTWDFDDDTAEMRRRYPRLSARCTADD